MALICRACLQNVDTKMYFYIDTFDNTQITNTIPKDVLQVCVPEMDLYISDQPVVCNECLTLFERFYNFKNKCLASEEKILTYLKKNKINPQCKINLHSVVYEEPEPILNGYIQHPSGMMMHNEHIVQLQQNNEIDVINLNGTSILPSPYFNKPVTEEILLSCNECAFVTMDRDKLFSHKCLSAPTPPPKFKCPYCDYTANRRYRLSYHINSKHTKSHWFECTNCDYKTTDSSSLRRHQKVIHCDLQQPEGAAATFNCPYCEFRTFSELALQRHRVSKHGPIIQYCNHCSYQTKDKSNFRKHMFIHGDKPRKCTKCDYQCVSPYQLQRHYRKIHV